MIDTGLSYKAYAFFVNIGKLMPSFLNSHRYILIYQPAVGTKVGVS